MENSLLPCHCGKKIMAVSDWLDWWPVWKVCFLGREFQMRKTHGGGWGWELKFRVCLKTTKGKKESGFMGNE